MIAHKNWIINLTMSSLIAVTCVVGDGKLQAIAGPLKRAIVDNSTHGLIGFFSALIVLIDQLDGETEKLYLAVVCMMMSSLIDIDHFIAAKSVKLAVSGIEFHNFLIIFIYIFNCRMQQAFRVDHFSTTAPFLSFSSHF